MQKIMEAIRNGLREVRPAPDGVAAPDLADPSPSPERLLMSARVDGEVLAAIGQLSEDNEQLQLLEGICDKCEVANWRGCRALIRKAWPPPAGG